jgi:hypothetical protein
MKTPKEILIKLVEGEEKLECLACGWLGSAGKAHTDNLP